MDKKIYELGNYFFIVGQSNIEIKTKCQNGIITSKNVMNMADWLAELAYKLEEESKTENK